MGLLSRFGPLTGSALERTARAVIGEYWTITRSQVYRELTALAKRGLVEPGPTGPRDARPYGLTPAGESSFLTWLDNGPASDTIRIPMLVTMGFGASLPADRMRTILTEYRRIHEEKLASVRFLDAHFEATGADPYIRATVSFGLLYEEAVLRWIDQLPEAIYGSTTTDL